MNNVSAKKEGLSFFIESWLTKYPDKEMNVWSDEEYQLFICNNPKQMAM